MRLTHIFIYPIKGCGGISLKESQVLGRGLQYDRRWMLIDPEGRFISQRECPKMALISFQLSDESLEVSFSDHSISIPLQTPYQHTVKSSVWGDEVMAYLTDPVYDHWFSEILNKPIRLVSMQTDSRRLVENHPSVPNNEEVSFADGYPYLVVGQASIDLLNSKFSDGTYYNVDRFRPNLVFSGGAAHEEDTWEEFRIGETVFKGVKACARCQVITINQQTAVSGKEPLSTLATYRRKGNKVLFGQNVLLQSGTRVKVGDRIEVVSTGRSPISTI